MKKHLFGLGAMLVGAGLMFVLMHGEVEADSKPEPFVCSEFTSLVPQHCKAGKISCGVTGDAISCVTR